MHLVASPLRRVSTNLLSNGLPDRRAVITTALQPQKWNTETQGPFTVDNALAYFRKSGYMAMDYKFQPKFSTISHSHSTSQFVTIFGGIYYFAFEDETVKVGPGEYFEPPLDRDHTEGVDGDNETYAVLATRDIGLILVFRVLKFWSFLTSILQKLFKS